MPGPTILWFRNDLRLADNPALRAAVDRGAPVVPVFIWSPQIEGDWAPGGAGKVWLHDSLRALQEALDKKGSRLVFRQGSPIEVLRDLIDETRAEAVYFNRRYEPAIAEYDEKILATLEKDNIEVKRFNGNLVIDPDRLLNKQGGPFKVFTPFWKAAVKEIPVPEPSSEPRKLRAPKEWPRSIRLADFDLLPKVDWAGGIRHEWQPGEHGAKEQLKRFLKEALANYPTHRDIPGTDGTSRLSPYLRHGELGPRTVLYAVQNTATEQHCEDACDEYIRQLYWREFGYYLLHHFPFTPEAPLQKKFEHFPWRKSKKAYRAWCKGQTGYPIVDAGMRQLWQSGWMHNRVRMIVASFLVKDLLLPWQDGAAWFWDTLVDADLANNTLGWQWAGGCGADAAPYFRIFNPTRQGQRFDPDGAYVRRWVPELADLPDKYIHEPWGAPSAALGSAGIRLGDTYPQPIVDHKEARARALEAFEQIKAAS